MIDNADAFEIPPFLRRELTDEVKARLKRLTTRYQTRKIKNPPKHGSRKAKLLGPMFGAKIKAT